MKVNELTGGLLDLWVALCEGYKLAPEHPEPHENTGRYWLQLGRGYSVRECPPYSTSWCAGGPIIERDQIFLQPPSYDHWRATVSARTRTLEPANETQKPLNVRPVGRGAGETPLIAAMRAKVASHYGDEVPNAP